MPLLLKWVGSWIGSTKDFDLTGLDLDTLTLPLRGDKLTDDTQASTRRDLSQQFGIELR